MESVKDEERRGRLRAVEERLCDPCSIGNVDGLLDTVVALVSDCDHPAIRRMKNVEAYTSRCKYFTYLLSHKAVFYLTKTAKVPPKYTATLIVTILNVYS